MEEFYSQLSENEVELLGKKEDEIDSEIDKMFFNNRESVVIHPGLRDKFGSFECPECHSNIISEICNFCPKCGMRIQWIR